MTKLIDTLASAWFFLFVVFPFVAIITFTMALYFFDLSFIQSVLAVLAMLVLFIILIVTGVFNVRVTGFESDSG